MSVLKMEAKFVSFDVGQDLTRLLAVLRPGRDTDRESDFH